MTSDFETAAVLLKLWFSGMSDPYRFRRIEVERFLESFDAGRLADVPDFFLPTVIWALRKRLAA